MPKAPGVARRPHRNGTRLLQAHIDPDLRNKVRDAATAAGVTMAMYLEGLIERDQLDDQGRPVWWRDLTPENNTEELFDLTG